MGSHPTVTIRHRQLEDQIMYLQSTLATLEAQLNAQGGPGHILTAGLVAAENQEEKGNHPAVEETLLPIAAG